MKKANTNQLIAKLSQDPQYEGKQVVVMGKEIHILSTKNKAQRAKLLISLVEKYPRQTPTIAFIPKQDTLILIL